MPLEDGTQRVVDLDTGDLYVWDPTAGNSGMYVLEPREKEIVVETEYIYVPAEVDPDDVEPSIEPDVISDLETQVNDLEDQVMLLENEIEILSAYNAASDQNLGSTNLTIFAGLVSKVPYGEHYVYWRNGQSSYMFAFGDLSLEGDLFTGSGDVTIITYSNSGTNMNNNYTWSVSTDRNFSLDGNDRLVYSDLGNYPALTERRLQEYAALTAYTVFGAMLFCLFDRLRSACFRR